MRRSAEIDESNNHKIPELQRSSTLNERESIVSSLFECFLGPMSEHVHLLIPTPLQFQLEHHQAARAP